MNAVTEEKRVSLYYKEGSSDKEYHVAMEPKGTGFVVNFQYGRRGSTLSTGTKTSTPVEHEQAVKTFDQLVKEKKAKGYTEGESGTPYQHSESRPSGLLPQLLNAIDEEEVSRLVAHPQWCMQEKLDGKRMLLRKENGVIQGINKKGLIVGVPQTILATAAELKGDFVLDGECMGDCLHVFDLLFHEGKDLRHEGYERRYVALLNLLFRGLPKHIKIVSCWKDAQDKASRLLTLKHQKAEGVVFKQRRAPYTSGRPSTGGTQLKHKFYATLSAVVAKVNTQRSVALRLLNHEGWQPVGNVTIPANQRIPQVGTVVEVRYLYAYRDGSLYQPIYLGERTDVDEHECVVSQLKYKPEEEEA